MGNIVQQAFALPPPHTEKVLTKLRAMHRIIWFFAEFIMACYPTCDAYAAHEIVVMHRLSNIFFFRLFPYVLLFVCLLVIPTLFFKAMGIL